ncbi:MAG: fructose-bisphosphate aldolase class I [Alphaproteobacteria bacterium]|nr:fructose-bisphosphate aldolase class I [Alphaproteobacteria bacterium]MDX5367950.1 fructose-bisphosphate aldolase class I [Alphaproteobacteria bacterium]MDX5462803.1 fructose-bisphosphate aldolase class I [Alphaproteobacteria bacterium]
MNIEKLETTAHKIVSPGRGILAADESTGTIKKRFDQIGVESTEANRNGYREMLFRTAGFGDHISGVILYDEQFRAKARDGSPLISLIAAADSVPGIKVDAGAKDQALFPGEKVTEGLDGLSKRMAEYAALGAGFAKWRAVIDIADGVPTRGNIVANAHALARYAAICQEHGVVPIVEPEVLMDGGHDIDRCFEVTEAVLNEVYDQLYLANVRLEGTLLKPNMVIAGKKSPKQASVAEVAEKTVACLKRTVPAAVPGIVFLSGGQSEEEATAHLDAMNKIGNLPWALSFSYGRALQQAALKAWGGKDENWAAAQRAFAHRARMNGLAAKGEWSEGLEKAA